MSMPGFRRRVLIEPNAGVVTAALEDDWHRMAVSLQHQDSRITGITSRMDRAPWTTCPGATEQLALTFTGACLAAIARRGERTSNCTHLYDLALLAARHAGDTIATTYDIEVADPQDGQRTATLRQDRVLVFEWVLSNDRLLTPSALAGRRLTEMGDWISSLQADQQESARLLRWATMMSFGRQMVIPDHSSGERFAFGACFTLQPNRAGNATRLPHGQIDFSQNGRIPLAD